MSSAIETLVDLSADDLSTYTIIEREKRDKIESKLKERHENLIRIYVNTPKIMIGVRNENGCIGVYPINLYLNL